MSELRKPNVKTAEEYKALADSEGHHSKTGKFYWRKYLELREKADQVVDELLGFNLGFTRKNSADIPREIIGSVAQEWYKLHVSGERNGKGNYGMAIQSAGLELSARLSFDANKIIGVFNNIEIDYRQSLANKQGDEFAGSPKNIAKLLKKRKL